MGTDCERYKIVYECYESRILFGFYAYDDLLPPVPTICNYFRMPMATVRFALARLEEAGYIQITDRKPARVVYKANLQKYRRNMAEYFVMRRDGIADLLASGGLMLSQLIESELGKWGEDNWNCLKDDLFHPHSGGVSAAVRFYALVFEGMGNHLLPNLYSEIIRYLGFPYLAEDDAPEQVKEAASREEALALFLKNFQADRDYAVAKLYDFINRAGEEFSLTEEEQIPFRWNVYRNRPQMRYTAASFIIQEIIGGQYPVGSYLPSLPLLAQQHEVGINTVRRALEILNKMGVTETFHGKGTLACMKPAEIDFTDPDLSEGLHLFMESLQMLALTIQPVLLHVLDTSAPEQRKAHIQKYAYLRKKQESYRGIDVCMRFIEEVCPMAFIRECYRKIRELLAWGYPIAILRAKEEGRSIHEIYAGSMERIETYLEKGDDLAVSNEWKQVLEADVKAYVPRCFP